MVTQETVADILRPLAERRVLPEGQVNALDPRFDALRCRHPEEQRLSVETYWGSPVEFCRLCGKDSAHLLNASLGLITSLDAILLAAKACGYETFRAVLEALLDWFDVDDAPMKVVAARALSAAVEAHG